MDNINRSASNTPKKVGAYALQVTVDDVLRMKVLQSFCDVLDLYAGVRTSSEKHSVLTS